MRRPRVTPTQRRYLQGAHDHVDIASPRGRPRSRFGNAAVIERLVERELLRPYGATWRLTPDGAHAIRVVPTPIVETCEECHGVGEAQAACAGGCGSLLDETNQSDADESLCVDCAEDAEDE